MELHAAQLVARHQSLQSLTLVAPNGDTIQAEWLDVEEGVIDLLNGNRVWSHRLERIGFTAEVVIQLPKAA